jgi:glucose/mannose transport system substrate-binding protein
VALRSPRRSRSSTGCSSYTNADASTLSWDQATQLVIDGDAAFNIMGDWAAGYFGAQGLEPGS